MQSLSWLGILIQALCLGWMVYRLRLRLFTHLGGLAVFVMFGFHGVTEVLHFFFPGYSHYRHLLSQEVLNTWIVLVSASIGLFTLSYYFAFREKNPSEPPAFFPLHRLLPPLPLMLALAILSVLIKLNAFALSYGSRYWL
jgi:hypothetical protein